MTRTQKNIARCVACSLSIALWLVLFDHVWPADSRTAEPAPRCAPDPGFPCTQQVVEQFKAGKLGRSTDLRFPLRIRNMIAAKLASGDMSSQDISDWWKFPFEMTQCSMWGKGVTECAKVVDSGDGIVRDGAAFGRVMDDTERVSVHCGGAAVIGFRMGGGWWGAGAGASGCLWETIFAKWWP